MKPSGITSVILAGGSSTRMRGKMKAFIEWRGKPLIQWVYQSVNSLSVIRQSHWHEVDVGPALVFFNPELFLNLNSPEDFI